MGGDQFRFSSFDGFNARLIEWRYKEFAKYFRGKSCLELGSSDGMGTSVLLDHFETVVAVDADLQALQRLKARFPTNALICHACEFEDMDLDRQFDTVVAAHVLEHVEDPQVFLSKVKKYLNSSSVLIIDVPNGDSLHRHIGVEMGLLGQITDLNETDLTIGHRRVYVPDTFKTEIARAGLQILEFGGIFLKVLSNSQTEALFSEGQIRAFLNIGRKYPEIAAEIYAITECSPYALS